jgi:PEP-CTERM motif
MRRLLNAARVIRAAAVVLCSAGAVHASMIIITNPSFEVNSGAPVPGWTSTGNVSEYAPGTSQFPGGIPDGSQVAAVDLGGSISQTVAATLTANTQYTLQVSVGQRADLSLSGFLISFDAGGNLLASASSPLPSPGTFDAVTVTFLAGASDPHLGEALSITLATTGANQANFDAVSLGAVSTLAVPEPGTWVLMLAGLALVGCTARRKVGNTAP